MTHCPACGAANEPDARFCSECQTKLDSYSRVREEGSSPITIAPGEAKFETKPGLHLATLSLILALLGLGPLALILGITAWRREYEKRKQALAAIIIGAAVTLLLLLLVAGAFRRGDPLRRPLTLDRVPAWVEAASVRLDELDSLAADYRARNGEGSGDELAPVYSTIQFGRDEVEALGTVEDQEELAGRQHEILDRIEEAKRYLAGR
jgi:predicted nucleic acid-binding Zn ribbon protein